MQDVRVCLSYRRAIWTSVGRAVAFLRGFSNSDPTSLLKSPLAISIHCDLKSPAQLTDSWLNALGGSLELWVCWKSAKGFLLMDWGNGSREREKGSERSFKKHFWPEISECTKKEEVWLFLEGFFFSSRKLEVNQTSTFSHFYGWELPSKNIHEKEQMNKCKQKIPKPAKLLKHHFNMLHMWNIYMHLKPDEISQWLSYVTTRLH